MGKGRRDESRGEMRCSDAPKSHGSNVELGLKEQLNGGLGTRETESSSLGSNLLPPAGF